MRVKNLNSTRDEIKRLRDKITVDLRALVGLCSSMEAEIRRRYYEEINKENGDTDGLESFDEVSRILKKDMQALNGALAIVTSKVNGVLGYDFEEMTEEGK